MIYISLLCTEFHFRL